MQPDFQERVRQQITLRLCASVIASLAFATAATAQPANTNKFAIETDYLVYGIGADGRTEQFVDKRTRINYAISNSPCARIKLAGKEIPATRATFKDGFLTLQFGDDTKREAVIQMISKKDYLIWKVVSLSASDVQEFVFADVPLTLKGSAGEGFAATAMALNLQTLVTEFPQPSSHLKASCFPRFGFSGAEVALLGCPAGELRHLMQQVVTAAPELPKSHLGGPWAWDAPAARGSYLFDFGNLNEQTVSDWIKLVQSLGFNQIDFHGGRSFRFGDCRVNPEVFPRGREGYKVAIDQLHAAGISAGLHTYAFFIDKKAEWVTPVPDSRLAKDKSFTLGAEVTADAATIPVNESTEGMSTTTGFFVRNSVTLRIENELITFTGISKSAPYAFTGCQRGAYGTHAAAHAGGAKADHLKECFGLFVPDGDSTLLAEVAQRSADFYNECGFDMIYLDALDGEDILGGAENAWHYGSKFVFELAKRLEKPALMEMSTFHHHLWYVRSRAGAWDHPRRAEKEFIDLHLAANEANHRMFLPGNLGWWAVKHWSGSQEERTFPDDIEYLCGKALATDSGLSLMGIDPKNAAGMSRLAEIFKAYETLRHAGTVSGSIKAKLAVPRAEFELVAGENAAPSVFRSAEYMPHKVGATDDRSNIWMVTNHFDAQPVRLRIEPLMAAGPWDAETNLVLFRPEDLARIGNPDSATGVSLRGAVVHDIRHGPSDSLRLSVTNRTGSARGAWTKLERTFDPPLNLSGREGLGVWVHGDGQRELLNFQLRSPEHVVAGIGDHYVIVDFNGWRYFELVEPESRRWAQYKWPYGDPYSIYRESVSFSQVSSISIWFNDIPAAKSVTCHIDAIKALPLSKQTLHHPAITIGDQTVAFPVDLETGSYLEMASATDCKIFGPNGELKAQVKPEGVIPKLMPGENRVGFTCETSSGMRARANVTVVTAGQPLAAN